MIPDSCPLQGRTVTQSRFGEIYCLGDIYETHTFKQQDSPRYRDGGAASLHRLHCDRFPTHARVQHPPFLKSRGRQRQQRVPVGDLRHRSRTKHGHYRSEGGGARLASVGDIVIIMTYVEVEEPVPARWEPRLIMLNEKNQISDILTLDKIGGSQALYQFSFDQGSAPPPNNRIPPSPGTRLPASL